MGAKFSKIKKNKVGAMQQDAGTQRQLEEEFMRPIVPIPEEEDDNYYIENEYEIIPEIEQEAVYLDLEETYEIMENPVTPEEQEKEEAQTQIIENLEESYVSSTYTPMDKPMQQLAIEEEEEDPSWNLWFVAAFVALTIFAISKM